MPTDVAALYEQFFALGGPPKGATRVWHYRRKITSLRLPACLLLADLIRTRRPAAILDLGSGVTTHVIRVVAAEVGSVQVVTTDTAPLWLARTIAELRRDEIDPSRCLLQGDFEQWNGNRQYGLICVDYGNTSYRLGAAPKIAQWCAPDGVIFLDDFHNASYAANMTAALTSLGFTVTPRSDTLDEFGGFVALAERK
jgi:hypothetical protein